MNPRQLSKDAIIKELARETAKRVSSRVIYDLQRLTDGKLSGDDSGLKNAWEEICVQVQFEKSPAWEAYEETARAIIGGEIAALPPYEREALWLQTEPGFDWAWAEESKRRPCPVREEDMVAYILQEQVLPKAGEWTNTRIRAYLERSTRTD